MHYRVLIIRGSGLGKTNGLLNLIKQKPDIDKLFVKDLYEAKYQTEAVEEQGEN